MNDRIIVIEPGAKAVKVQNWMRKFFILDWKALIKATMPNSQSEALYAAYG